MKCPKCQTDNPSSSKFCSECAAPLRGHVPDSPESGTGPPNSQSAFPMATETMKTPAKELATGSIFAGRYQMIEELGHGGMGKVYRAVDKKLNEEVAIKVIKPEIARDKGTLERFQNELKVARKISHRNVGRMYELMEDRGIHFITMEYVPGEDLRSFLHRSKRLTIGTAVDIAKDVCEGLTEAHRLGVVHRDLKPSNIIIDKDGNARIMDFGIARSLRTKSLTGEGVIIGTPEYMSPEQVEGKDVDLRSDIYSLGVILYEMITGRVPFEGETPLSVAVRQKTEAAPDPRKSNAQVPDNLNQLVLKCLEKEKAKRYQTAAELHADLERIKQGLPATERIMPERKPFTSKEITVKFRPTKLIIPALVVIAVIIAAIIFWPKKAPNLDPNLVAISVFENKTGDPKLDPIGSMAAERIMQGLKQVGLFYVAPMPSAEAVAAASKGKDKLRALADLTKAGKIVHGDYYLQKEDIQFHAWVEDMAAKTNLLAFEPASGPMADPAAALEPLRLKLMGGLAGIFDPGMQETFSFLKEPPNFEAYREYIEGARAFGRYDFQRAIEHFLRAADRDPKLRVAEMFAAVAYTNLGENAKADELTQKVEKSRADLSSMERLVLDWLQAYLQGDYETDLRVAREIVSFSRTQLWMYVNGLYAVWSNYPREAVSVLSRYDPYAPTYTDWTPSFWGVLTTAHHMLGNHKQELKEARRGRKQFPERLWMLVNEVDALAALGRIKDLQNLFEESKTLPPQSGYSPGSIILDAGRELRAHGYKEDSIRVLNQALQWFESRPAQEKASVGNRYSQATTLYILGRWAEARTLFEGLHGDVPANIGYLGYLGSIAVRLGDKDVALKVTQQLEEDKRPYLFGGPTFWRARIAALLGDKEGAVNLLRQATKQGYAYPSLHLCEDFESLADYPPYVQLMKPRG